MNEAKLPKPVPNPVPKPAPVDAAARMTTAEATVGALIAHGIDTIYALPGVHNDSLFDTLFSAGDRIQHILVRGREDDEGHRGRIGRGERPGNR